MFILMLRFVVPFAFVCVIFFYSCLEDGDENGEKWLGKTNCFHQKKYRFISGL